MRCFAMFYYKWFYFLFYLDLLDVIEIQACRRRVISYIGGISVGLIWLITKHWTFHNLFAISFCLQV